MSEHRERDEHEQEHEHEEPINEQAPFTVNNYRVGVYQDGELFIQTTPDQLRINKGRVYLRIIDCERLLAYARRSKEE